MILSTSKGVFIATQLNSTRQREQQLTQFVGHDVINKNTTELAVRYSTGSVEFSGVEFGWVELCRYKHPLSQILTSQYYSTSNNLQMVQDKGYIYNGGLIESHTSSIEPCHFQWPWTTPNPDFKVRPFFDAEYLQNG